MPVYGRQVRTIPEFHVRGPHQAKGVGSALLMEAKRMGRQEGGIACK